MQKPLALPMYRRIAEDIANRIRSGELAPGDKVPSTRDITRRWDVAIATATKALTAVQREGLTVAVAGVGTLVRETNAVTAATRTDASHRVDRDQVVRAAVAIADLDGLEKLSMRRLATTLNIGAMTLYHHVANKEHLVRLMVDMVFVDEPELGQAHWREKLESMCRRQWDHYQRHPWLTSVISFSQPVLSLNAIAHTETGISAFDELEIPKYQAVHEVIVLSAFVLGLAQSLPAAPGKNPLTDEQWRQTRSDDIDEIVDVSRFPRLASMPDSHGSLDEIFEYGLRRHLDGLAFYLGVS